MSDSDPYGDDFGDDPFVGEDDQQSWTPGPELSGLAGRAAAEAAEYIAQDLPHYGRAIHLMTFENGKLVRARRLG